MGRSMLTSVMDGAIEDGKDEESAGAGTMLTGARPGSAVGRE